eukprot:m.30932 g.30932  ORF g.30932 m.30932 type:complete len:471 (+) comp6861_c0_seq1:97-1509(+)
MPRPSQPIFWIFSSTTLTAIVQGSAITSTISRSLPTTEISSISNSVSTIPPETHAWTSTDTTREVSLNPTGSSTNTVFQSTPISETRTPDTVLLIDLAPAPTSAPSIDSRLSNSTLPTKTVNVTTRNVHPTRMSEDTPSVRSTQTTLPPPIGNASETSLRYSSKSFTTLPSSGVKTTTRTSTTMTSTRRGHTTETHNSSIASTLSLGDSEITCTAYTQTFTTSIRPSGCSVLGTIPTEEAASCITLSLGRAVAASWADTSHLFSKQEDLADILATITVNGDIFDSGRANPFADVQVVLQYRTEVGKTTADKLTSEAETWSAKFKNGSKLSYPIHNGCGGCNSSFQIKRFVPDFVLIAPTMSIVNGSLVQACGRNSTGQEDSAHPAETSSSSRQSGADHIHSAEIVFWSLFCVSGVAIGVVIARRQFKRPPPITSKEVPFQTNPIYRDLFADTERFFGLGQSDARDITYLY